jgi:hypothetical protein
MTTTYIGLFDGLHCPGEGCVLDEVNCVWVQQETTDVNV